MGICKRCMISTKALNVVLDHNNICNLCKTYDQLESKICDVKMMQKNFQNRIETISGKHQYDALVGLSGGKDSSYVALQLVRKFGLRILLFTYDNGYLSKDARANIIQMVKALNQDHVFVKPGDELQSVISRASIKNFGIPCIGCTFPGFLSAINIAMQRQIPLIIHGRSPAQMFKELAPGSADLFLPFLNSNFSSYSPENNKSFLTSTTEHLLSIFRRYFGKEIFSSPSLTQLFNKLYLPDFSGASSSSTFPEFIGYFLYEQYDEKQIKNVLEKEVRWKRPKDDRFMGHSDCRVHAAAVYLYAIHYGHPIVKAELATLVRQGIITRNQASARIKLEIETQNCNTEAMKELENICGLNEQEIIKYALKARRRLVMLRRFFRLRQHLAGSFLRMPLQ